MEAAVVSAKAVETVSAVGFEAEGLMVAAGMDAAVVSEVAAALDAAVAGPAGVREPSPEPAAGSQSLRRPVPAERSAARGHRRDRPSLRPVARVQPGCRTGWTLSLIHI